MNMPGYETIELATVMVASPSFACFVACGRPLLGELGHAWPTKVVHGGRGAQTSDPL